MIEKEFDIPFVAALALSEKQIQQNYRPIIAVHKWFARRPGTLFRAILLSEFSNGLSLKETFYRGNKLNGIRIADPFMGGGTPLLEANRLGCDVIGYDINPMAYWIVKQEIETLDLNVYKEEANKLRNKLEEKIGYLYHTRCNICGYEKADAKYFLWIKYQVCKNCGKTFDLFPGYLISKNKRHPRNVIVCSICGEFTEAADLKKLDKCMSCGSKLLLQGPAKRNHCICPSCGIDNKFPNMDQGPPKHRMFAIEYNCPICKSRHKGRFFKKPDSMDLHRYNEAIIIFNDMEPIFVPEDKIPSGDETDRLHRWGYRHYSEMFNYRQLLGLELSCQIINTQPNEKIKYALATNLSDLLRYQNMLCRYDTMALKSLDIFSIHGYPVGLIQCESNLLGIPNGKMSIGSGGWSNIIDKFIKAKSFCESPFEVSVSGKRKKFIYTTGEWIGDANDDFPHEKRSVEIYCKNAIYEELPASSLDAVLTDPPYYGNVQYAELMDFCYVWLRKLVKDSNPEFNKHTTRNFEELTKNTNMNRGLEEFTGGLSMVFQHMAKALKFGSPLVFTYHHNKLDAYFPIAVAILDSGFVCTASIPCPAEMGASIHIKGTKSSTIDTIFVCRSKEFMPIKSNSDTISTEEIANYIEDDMNNLKYAMRLTEGDIRCLTYGHLTRLATYYMSDYWDNSCSINEKLAAIKRWIDENGFLAILEKKIKKVTLNKGIKYETFF
ncbi:hypothetical protein P0O24_06800 [Methanotrichaceae archaeon M04Ac]|uniref:DUF1156 domain-containing protein n=1 Tax=Candidatus Methanocrinis alkalitolerans TaxID=3033395 RepID=A0ABT5XEZ1_9EURY|nr:hypothetical protein [Candidatus Methanocrinis alkalitolerans]MDF0593287.1 hypothetical protein [Candidatus Methanocrinis alkalitolerans]